MDPVVLAGSLSGVELGALASLVFVLVAPVIIALALERSVFRNGADPVGLDELERDEDVDGEVWK